MGAALEGGFDLAALSLCFVALALLVAAKELAQAIAGPLDFSIFGVRPLHRVASAIENRIVGTLDDAIRGVEKAAAGFESGLIDAFGMLIAIPILIGLGVKAALEYLWNHALRPLIHSITDSIRTTAQRALARAVELESTVAANLAAAERYARDRAASALDAAEAYVDRRVAHAVETLRGDISSGVASAEKYADTAVSKLRSAEDEAISNAVGLAVAAKVAGELAAANALQEAERVAGSALAQSEAAAANALQAAERAAGSALAQSEAAAAEALARAQAAGQAALAGVRGIAVGAESDLAAIEGAFGAAGVGTLIGSIPALATLVTAIAVEAGLENAACRTKVKGICGTDPAEWLGLLEGAALLTGALSLREIVPVARFAMHELTGLIREAA